MGGPAEPPKHPLIYVIGSQAGSPLFTTNLIYLQNMTHIN